ncbi:MAG: type I DNA topoisomerase [Clostridia bacterium]|nr:type I DNA topoisomerase [Clostridia bacterium]
MMNLVIVESPTKAGTIEKYLGSSYKVIASMGHLRDLPKSTLGVDIENDFAPKYIVIKGKGDLVKQLKNEAKNADKVFIATDPDREGEAIAWHIAALLGISPDKKCRVSFNEITKSAVTAAIKSPRAIDLQLVDSQQARRILDRILGYKLSPLLWKKVRKGLSAGRVQSVTTRLLVDREREILNFEPEEYWNLSALLYETKPEKSIEARFLGKNGKKQSLHSKADVDKVLSELAGAEYTITDVKLATKKKNPAPPFTTSTMQQEASRKLNFTSKRTMTAAQTLYEGVNIPGKGAIGLITYMRTDSLHVAENAKTQFRAYIGEKYGQEYLPETPRSYKSGKNAQDAHEAIRPTTTLEPEAIRSALSNDQYRLYKLIWSRFMASQMASAVYDTMTADVSANSYVFKINASKLHFPGYTKVYVEGTDTEEEKDLKELPKLTVGQKLNLKELVYEQHFTEPPPRYTEASLIKEMEELGIGRPSTYAPTISTILARMYAEREKKTLLPTELGMIVTDLMLEHFNDIVDVEFTANMEERLDEIETGDGARVQILREFYEPFASELSTAEEKIDKIKLKDEETDVVCEVCGRNMVIKVGRYGKFLACPGFPECRNTMAITVDTGVACPKCNARILEKTSKKGKKYYGCEKAPTCDFVLWYPPTDKKCPKCGSVMIRRGKRVLCSNPECKGE